MHKSLRTTAGWADVVPLIPIMTFYSQEDRWLNGLSFIENNSLSCHIEIKKCLSEHPIGFFNQKAFREALGSGPRGNSAHLFTVFHVHIKWPVRLIKSRWSQHSCLLPYPNSCGETGQQWCQKACGNKSHHECALQLVVVLPLPKEVVQHCAITKWKEIMLNATLALNSCWLP